MFGTTQRSRSLPINSTVNVAGTIFQVSINPINQYLIYNALVYNKSLSVKTVGLLNSQERGYYFRLVIVQSASEEVRLELCLKGCQTV